MMYNPKPLKGIEKYTMKLLTYIAAILLLTSCQEAGKHSSEQQETTSASAPDTIVGSKPITDEIPGSAYRESATGYFVIVGTDTSDYMPVFTKSKDDGHIVLDLRLPHFNDNLTFGQRMQELSKILPRAATEYNFDSLSSISIGRLMLTGDLAIEVTAHYKEKIGEPATIQIDQYKKISEFLKASPLGHEFNKLFAPFSLTVDHIDVEKVYFADKDEFFKLDIKTKTDSSEIPDKILDCLTRVRLKKE